MSTDIRIKKRTCLVYLAVLFIIVYAFVSSGVSSRGSCTSPLVLQDATEPPVLYSVVKAERIAQDVSYPNSIASIGTDGVHLIPRPREIKRTIIPDLPMIYAITPTYARPVQKAELTRLSQTLMWLENFHWIVIEDSDNKTTLVENFLKRTNLMYTHLVSKTVKKKGSTPTAHWMKARGVEQRNAGLDWLRKNLDPNELNGVLFFMDDDNTYALDVFDEMRKVRKVGVWPVGLVGGVMVEKPLVNDAGDKVVGFNSAWRPERPFPIDMAGFAIHLRLIMEHPHAVFSHKVQAGYQETEILRQIITRDQLEPLADRCSKVYVWHTRTEKPTMKEENKLIAKNKVGSNVGIEV